MAAQLLRSHGVRATLTSGGRGEFTINVDGQVVYDKAVTHQFPSDAEAVAAVATVAPAR